MSQEKLPKKYDKFTLQDQLLEAQGVERILRAKLNEMRTAENPESEDKFKEAEEALNEAIRISGELEKQVAEASWLC